MRAIDNLLLNILRDSLNEGKASLDVNSIYHRLELRCNKVSESYLRERLKVMEKKGKIYRNGRRPKPYLYSLSSKTVGVAR